MNSLIDNDVKYITVEVINTDVGYGLDVYSRGKRELTYRDITNDKARIDALAKTINSLQVSLLHINDIIEDFLE